MIPLNSIGTALKKYREIKNLSKDDIAQIIDISPKLYQKIESGERPVSLKVLKNIFERLEVTNLEL